MSRSMMTSIATRILARNRAHLAKSQSAIRCLGVFSRWSITDDEITANKAISPSPRAQPGKLLKRRPISNNQELVRRPITSHSISLSEHYNHQTGNPENKSSSSHSDHWFEGIYEPTSEKNLVTHFFELSQRVSSNQSTVDQIVKDKNWEWVCEMVHNMANKWSDFCVVSIMISFLEMGVPETDEAFQLLESECLWKSRQFSISLLIRLLEAQMKNVNLEKPKLSSKTVGVLSNHVLRKLDDVVLVDDLLKLCNLAYNGLLDDKEIATKLEELALEFITIPSSEKEEEPKQDTDDIFTSINRTQMRQRETFSYDHVCHLLTLLARGGRRPTPLLRAAVAKVASFPSSTQKPRPIHLINAICSLNQLSFFDYNLIHRLTEDLSELPFLEETKSTSIAALYSALTLIGYKSDSLLTSGIEHICKSGDVPLNVTASIIITLAKLNFDSQPYEGDLQRVISRINKESFQNDIVYLEFVWALCLLRLATVNHISSVCNVNFLQGILEGNSSSLGPMTPYLHSKILNILGHAEVEFKKGSQGFEKLDLSGVQKLLSNIERDESLQLIRPQAIQTIHESLIETLKSFLSPDKYIASSNMFRYGFVIDAEIITNESGRALPIKDHGSLANNYNYPVLNPLPPEFYRVAFISTGYKDYLINGINLNGTTNFWVRLLKKLDYKVVLVQQRDLPYKSTPVQRVQNLKSLIKDAL